MAAPTELQFTNGAETTLSGALAQTITSAAATDGSVFPTASFRIVLWDKATYPNPNDDPLMEIIECSSRTGNTLTVTRAQEGTADVTHDAGTTVRLSLTAGGLQNIHDRIDLHVHTGGTQGVQLDHGGALLGLTDDDHTQYLHSGPATTGRNVIQPSAAGGVPLVLKAHASQTADLLQIITSASAALFTVTNTGNLVAGDGRLLQAGTTTGFQIASTANEKLGFWGATPIVRPASTMQAAVVMNNTNGEIAGITFGTGYEQTVCEALRDKCEELADDVRAINVLLTAIREAAVNTGLIKGDA